MKKLFTIIKFCLIGIFKNKNMKGKCPVNNRNIPCFILINNKMELAITDGKGDCYRVEGLGFYEQLETKCIQENKVNPKDYEFERFLSGMEF